MSASCQDGVREKAGSPVDGGGVLVQAARLKAATPERRAIVMVERREILMRVWVKGLPMWGVRWRPMMTEES